MSKRPHLHLVKDTAKSAEEWVGGRVPSPFTITGEGNPYTPDIALWLEMPSALVMGSEILPPGAGDDALAQLLRRAMRKPMVGAPRVPASVRVATAAEATRVRKVLPGSATAVRVGPTPEIDEVVALMASDVGQPAALRDYLAAGTVSPEKVADFFHCAKLLYQQAPWKHVDDDQVFRIDIPELDITEACLSVIGALGENCGFLLFDSFDDYDLFVSVGTAAEDDGPDDILPGNTCMLTFESADDLPPRVRRGIEQQGWPVAGPRAYPYLVRCDRHGVPVPVTDRELTIGAAVTLALFSFYAKHRREFDFEDPEPHCESYQRDDDLLVTITYPHEAYELFEVGPPSVARDARDGAQRGGHHAGLVRRPGRNEFCPCGSGKKYKKCHMALDEAAAASAASSAVSSAVLSGAAATDAAALHDLDRRLLDSMFAFADRRFGRKWLSYRRDFRDAEEPQTLGPHWAAYHFPIEGRPLCDWYELERDDALSAAERAWLRAQRHSWLTVWEVREVTPGSTITLADVLTGAERTVVEKSASRQLTPRFLVLGRVAELNGVAVITGLHPCPLRPMDAEPVLQAARARARRQELVPIERVREVSFGRLLLRTWSQCEEAVVRAAATPLQLHNTDGDKLLVTVDVFDIEPVAVREVELRLAAIEGAHEIEDCDDEERSAFTLSRKAREGSALEYVMIARVGVRQGELEIGTNSLARADEARAVVKRALGDLVQHRERTHPKTDAMGAIAPGRRDAGDSNARHGRGAAGTRTAAGSHRREEQAAVRAFKAHQYQRWLDEKIPALGGVTPRQAARTAKGKRALDLLLRDMECMERTLPVEEQYDFNVIRRALGIG